VPRGRRTFASDDCVHRWKLRTQPGYVRQQVWNRDRGICGVCGVDTAQQDAAAQQQRQNGRRWRKCLALASWHAHHIIPVAEGGGECDLSNYQTLCRDCHVRITAEWHARRAATRKQQEGLP
jgi:5-methylcytosine-specific restriction endonuclease McrA